MTVPTPHVGAGAARTAATRGALQARAAAARAEAARLRAQYWDTLAVPACAIAGLRTAAMVRCELQSLFLLCRQHHSLSCRQQHSLIICT